MDMVLQDLDDMPGAVTEVGRVLAPGGAFCLAIPSPVSTAGAFAGDEPDSPFMVEGSYLDPGEYRGTAARGGLTVDFRGRVHTLEDYARAREDAGLVIEALREPPAPDDLVTDDPAHARVQRIPITLYARARKERHGSR